ncbi:hypothetical protein J5N97_030206 [Dioscorea zingiberensis]|uniref:Uncharacterized protein n=1 Tax=Dioscorea zingiberensis TaxID=325984 RepID=A0A9D5BX88_9LILI|nr:hypothetical protein J5N97_030206 [Dioscorea zingiberensis]
MGTITHCLHCPPLTAQPKKRNLFSLPIKPLPLLRASTHHPFPLTTHDSLRHYRKHLARSTAHSSFFPQTLPSIDDLSNISPLTVCKWSAIVSLALFAARKTVSTLLNPFFWTYFSWSWIFWPWLLAISLAIYGLYCFYKHSTGQSSLFEQLAIVTSTITWLTLVPPAHFNGFLQGWPIAIFFIYHYFFFFESTVRRRLYGDLYPRAHDPKWDVTLPLPFRIAFAVLVFVGHWLAAREAGAAPDFRWVGEFRNSNKHYLILLTVYHRSSEFGSGQNRKREQGGTVNFAQGGEEGHRGQASRGGTQSYQDLTVKWWSGAQPRFQCLAVVEGHQIFSDRSPVVSTGKEREVERSSDSLLALTGVLSTGGGRLRGGGQAGGDGGRAALMSLGVAWWPWL